jgi:hypothetical protein
MLGIQLVALLTSLIALLASTIARFGWGRRLTELLASMLLRAAAIVTRPRTGAIDESRRPSVPDLAMVPGDETDLAMVDPDPRGETDLAMCDRVLRDRAGAARTRVGTHGAVIGELVEIEVVRWGRTFRLPASPVEIRTDGRDLRICCARIGLVRRLRLGWRPWRQRIAQVGAVSYRSMRFLAPAGFGLLDRRGAALARRWGPPKYRHEFEGSAWLVCGVTGRLSIAGSFSLDRTRLGAWGMIRG